MRLAHRVGYPCSQGPPELATNNMRALPLNVNGSPSTPAEASSLLLPQLGPGVQKASCRAGSAYGVTFGPRQRHLVPHGIWPLVTRTA